MHYLGMLVLGIGVGLLSAALGMGGGILMVPAFLIFVPGMDVHTAKGTSLFIITLVAAVNVWRLNREHADWQWGLASMAAAGAIIGGFFGGWVTRFWSEELVTWVFILLLSVVGARTFFITEIHVEEKDVRARGLVTFVIGAAMGTASGMTGIGGGALFVPLALIAGITTSGRVVALSNMVMAATCTAGVAAHLTQKQTFPMPWTVGCVSFALAPLVFVGAQAGSHAGKWVNDRLSLRWRRAIMGVVLLLIVARLLRRVM